MAGDSDFGPRLLSMCWEWLRPFLSLVITASLFHPCSAAAVKPIGEPEFNEVILRYENGSVTAKSQVALTDISGLVAAARSQEKTTKTKPDSDAWIDRDPSPDSLLPMKLRHIWKTTLAVDHQPAKNNYEVFQIWQQTPFMPLLFHNPASER